MPTYSITTRGVLYGGSCVNVFHVIEDTPASSGSSEADIAERFIAQVIPSWMDVVSEDFILNCLEVAEVGAGVALPYQKTLATGNVGTVAEDALPPNRVYVVAFKTATYSRSGRGRKYISGIPESWEDDNAIDNSHRADLETMASAMATDLTGGAGGGSYSFAIYSPTLSTAAPITKWEMNPQVFTLRGRTAQRCG